MNYVEYINHTLYSPSEYFRRFDFDIRKMGTDLQRRVALAALPFIALYRPIGFSLSLTLGSIRTISHFQQALKEEQKGEWKKCAAEVAKLAVSALSLAGSVFRYTPAVFLTSTFDALESFVTFGDALWNKEWGKAFEEMLQTASLVSYVAFMVTGVLEVMVAFSLLQTALSVYQAGGEWKKRRRLEALCKLFMGGVRIYQMRGYLSLIEKRNAYLQMEKIQKLFLRALKGKEARHLIHHPLSSLKERIDANETILINHEGEEFHVGSHFHGNGGSLVKGENLIFRTKVEKGKELIELDFKVNHVFRKGIEDAMKDLRKIRPIDQKECLSLAGSHATNITISKGSFDSVDREDDIAGAYEVTVEGLGAILIGSEEDIPNLYNRVVVRLDADKSLYELHELLSLCNLDRAISLSTKDDIERLKMGHLFRTFFPRQATPFERTKEFFSLPLPELQKKMIEKAPEMKEVFSRYYDKMSEHHLFDGRVRYRIEGLGEAAYEKGARALTAAVMGGYGDKKVLFERVASMLKMGMLATEVRDVNEMDAHGLGGGGIDYYSGGADSVYTQLLTAKDCARKMPFDELNYDGPLRILFRLEVLEMGSYQYFTDAFGNRIYNPDGKSHSWFDDDIYADRDGILEFIEKKENKTDFDYGYWWSMGEHEVMLKERIHPSFFKKIIVDSEETKREFLAYLDSVHLIEEGKINQTPVDQFICVSKVVTEELVS